MFHLWLETFQVSCCISVGSIRSTYIICLSNFCYQFSCVLFGVLNVLLQVCKIFVQLCCIFSTTWCWITVSVFNGHTIFFIKASLLSQCEIFRSFTRNSIVEIFQLFENLQVICFGSIQNIFPLNFLFGNMLRIQLVLVYKQFVFRKSLNVSLKIIVVSFRSRSSQNSLLVIN